MKKMIFTTAAAVAIMAAPFAGKADAAQVQPIKTKVVYYQFDNTNLSDNADWFEQLCKKYNISWKKNHYNKVYHYSGTIKPEENKTETQKPVEKPVEQEKAPVEEQKPVEQEKAPVEEQKPVEQEKAPVEEQKPVEQETQKPSQNTNSSLSEFEQQVFDLTNQERTKNGLAPLKIDLELSKVAREKSRDMSANNYFDHNSPTYGSPFDMMKKFGITYRSAGENIAMGQRTPQEVVNAWMNSEGHRANILSSDFTHIGIGYDDNGNYWTQQFIGK